MQAIARKNIFFLFIIPAPLGLCCLHLAGAMDRERIP